MVAGQMNLYKKIKQQKGQLTYSPDLQSALWVKNSIH